MSGGAGPHALHYACPLIFKSWAYILLIRSATGRGEFKKIRSGLPYVVMYRTLAGLVPPLCPHVLCDALATRNYWGS